MMYLTETYKSHQSNKVHTILKRGRQALLALSLVMANTALAEDFVVQLTVNKNAEQSINKRTEQKAAFGRLIEQGVIKDMFISRIQLEGRPTQVLRFVLEADNEDGALKTLEELPMTQNGMSKILSIRSLGSKWLDNTPVYNNYGVTITWREGIEPLEIDRVLGIDLQRVISLNQAGLVTSSYIDTQELPNNVTRPIYSVSFLAQDAQHARELSAQFEAVTRGYATIEIQHLGHKVTLGN